MPWSLRLPLYMLSINSLGILARVLMDGKDEWMSFLAIVSSLMIMALPLLPLAALASIHVGRTPTEAILSGVLAALTGAFCCCVLLDPQFNQDANIGMGLYNLFGVIFPLGAAYLLGVTLSRVWLVLRAKI